MAVLMSVVAGVWIVTLFVVVYHAIKFAIEHYESESRFETLTLAWRHFNVTANATIAVFALWFLSYLFGG